MRMNLRPDGAYELSLVVGPVCVGYGPFIVGPCVKEFLLVLTMYPCWVSLTSVIPS
jgi:hypothetical protein